MIATTRNYCFAGGLFGVLGGDVQPFLLFLLLMVYGFGQNGEKCQQGVVDKLGRFTGVYPPTLSSTGWITFPFFRPTPLDPICRVRKTSKRRACSAWAAGVLPARLQ